MTSRQSTVPQFAVSFLRQWHDRRHRDKRARQAVRAKMGASGLHAYHSRVAKSSGSWGQTEPARPRCCNSPSGLLAPSAGTISVLGGRPGEVQPRTRHRWASWRRTRRHTPDCRSRSTSVWVHGSIRPGTVVSPSAGSISSASTRARKRARCLVVSGPRSPLRWPLPNVPSYSSSMSRWPPRPTRPA